MSQGSLFADISIKEKRKRKPAVNTVTDDAPLVVSFSGGRTSGRMLRLLLDSERKPDLVLFANTGREREETLEFIHACETRWAIEIVWLEYTTGELFDGQDPNTPHHRWRRVNYRTAHRVNQPNRPFDQLDEWMSVLPNVQARACTAQLKTKTMRRYLESIGLTSWRSAIGIRADETHRTIEIISGSPSFIRCEFPLIDLGITEVDVMEYWQSQDFDLGLGQDEGNCDGCFLKSFGKLVNIERRRPGTLKWWDEWEKRKTAGGCQAGGRFRDDRSFARIIEMAERPTLLDEMPDDEIGCSCTEGGWRDVDDDD